MFLKKTVNIWLPILIIFALVGVTFLNMFLDEHYGLEEGFVTRYAAAKNWMKTGLSPYSQETYDMTADMFDEPYLVPGH